MSWRDRFTETEWDTLRLSPFAAWVFIAESDRNASINESFTQGFQAERLAEEGELLGEVVESYQDEPEMFALTEQFGILVSSCETPEQAMAIAVAHGVEIVREKLGGTQAVLFSSRLEEFARAIAEADRDGVFGRRVSEAEASALEKVLVALKLS